MMKIIQSIEMDIPQMTEEKEGLLRGGFAMIASSRAIPGTDNGNCDCNCGCILGSGSNDNCNCSCSVTHANKNCNCNCECSTATSIPTDSSSKQVNSMNLGIQFNGIF